MKICYVAADVAVPHFRGSSTHVFELARHLAQLGNEVHVVARRVSSTQPALERIAGITIHRLQRGIVFSSSKSSFSDTSVRGSYRGDTSLLVWKSYEAYLRTIFPVYVAIEVMRLVRANGIDLILERETSFGAGAMASMMTGRPMVLEVIGNRVTNLQVRRSIKIVAYSRSMFEGKAEASKVETVTGAVDTELFQPDAAGGLAVRKKYSLGTSPVVGYVGTFQEWHGLAELILAARFILLKHPDTKFLMVGPYYKDTQKKIISEGLEGSFVFTGPIPYEEIPMYMNASEVLVAPYNPSKIESSEQVRKHGLGSPLKVFEYMAVGKPAITTDVRPISDPIQDGVTGYLVPPGDSEALGLTIVRILDDREAANKIGAAGRESVIRNFSWGPVARQLSAILESAVRSGPTRLN